MVDEEVAELDAWQPEGEDAENIDAADGSEDSDEDDQDADNRTPRNGYGELVRLGRSRGWVTLADINDYLPESALRTSENLQEVTEQLGRLGIQVFEAPPDEDDILINGMGGDNSDDIDEDDAAVMLTPEESVGLSKDRISCSHVPEKSKLPSRLNNSRSSLWQLSWSTRSQWKKSCGLERRLKTRTPR